MYIYIYIYIYIGHPAQRHRPERRGQRVREGRAVAGRGESAAG